MPHFSLPGTLCICLVSGGLFTSCSITKHAEAFDNMTLQGSIDKANLRETGGSAITYNAKTRENVIDYTEITVFGAAELNKGWFSDNAFAY